MKAASAASTSLLQETPLVETSTGMEAEERCAYNPYMRFAIADRPIETKMLPPDPTSRSYQSEAGRRRPHHFAAPR